jgi:hypothetical protein
MLVSLYYWLTLPFKSFYAPWSYRYHMERGKGFGILYLFGLIALLWLAITSLWIYKITRMHDTLATAYYEPATLQPQELPADLRLVYDVATQLPDITIEKGTVAISDPVPYIIMNSATKEPFLWIDTRTADADWKEITAQFLLTNKRLLMRQKDGTVVTLFDASSLHDPVLITVPNILGWLQEMEQMQTAMWFWGSGAMLIISMLLAFVYSVINQSIFQRYYQQRIPFAPASRFSTLSMTPMLLLYHSALILPQLHLIPLFGVIMLCLPVVYSVMMMRKLYGKAA